MNQNTSNDDTVRIPSGCARTHTRGPWILTATILALGFSLPGTAGAKDDGKSEEPVKATPRQFATDAPAEEKKEAKALEAAGKIVLPSVNFDGMTLEEAVKSLNTMAKKAAGDKPVPSIKLGPKVDGKSPIKELRLKQVPLRVALLYCAEATKTQLLADDETLTLEKR